MPRPVLIPLLLAVLLALSACDSAEERAAKHFASAETLYADGDAERALVELRNVFKLDEDHLDGRRLHGEILEARGALAEAAASYDIVVEQTPDDAGVHARLARLAITLRDRDRALRHATRAFEIDPGPPLHRALYATVTYRDGDRPAAVEMARGVLAEDPASLLANTVLISAAMDAGDTAGALAQTDAALVLNPTDLGLHVIRLSLLERLDRTGDVGRHLEAMVATFPDQPQIEDNLIRWYIRQGRDAQARDALSARADAGDARDALILARYLLQTDGAEAALAELDTRLEGATGPDRARLVRARAAIAFDTGDRDGAIAALEAATAGESDDETRLSQIALARMYAAEGHDDEAAALVETVLEQDPDMVEALKLRAARLITVDDTDGAIRDLRRALDQAPDDPATLTLMADVHTREGAHELAGERLALAVQASGNGRAESLRYARFLMRDRRLGPAESVVVDALRRAPEDPELLVELGRIHLARGDHPRVAQTAALLAGLDDARARAAADALRAQSLAAQEKTGEAVAFLEGLVADGTGDDRLRAAVPLIRTYVRDGELDRAEGAVTALEAEFPDAPVVRMLRAGLQAVGGDTAAAEATYRDLIEAGEGGAQPWLALHALLRRDNRPDEAKALLARGAEATGSAEILLLRARNLEREDRDYEGAIAIYEELYARDSANAMLANNLASMISAYRTGEADLDRAFTIARRLRGTTIPPYQDTYGWLLARRGEHREALTYLRPAATALRTDPLVAYHLGVAEAGAGNTDAALKALSAALSLGGDDAGLAAQMADAKARIAALEAARAEAAEAEEAAESSN